MGAGRGFIREFSVAFAITMKRMMKSEVTGVGLVPKVILWRTK